MKQKTEIYGSVHAPEPGKPDVRAKLDADVAAYLAAGGTITVLDSVGQQSTMAAQSLEKRRRLGLRQTGPGGPAFEERRV